MNIHCSVKYWSWLSVFTVSFVFWAQMAWMLTN
ncbi:MULTISPECIES: small membrane protein YmiC [Buttiauxella]|uniref:Small membrane protein YmiC n=1 Tax=Buttiauxella selenatireducens TaxID=3073902 RepID=A0ABY9SK63_9ENTR|nr:small membrane protein YmiC [Buttiauxella sp. R73]WMY76387.1 small membrane protein YmiC [Buttiauxella sp. R73]